MPNIIYVVVVLHTIIYLIGLQGMYGLVFCNRYCSALANILSNGPLVLRGSNNPILTHFIGFVPMDKTLTLAGIMWGNVTDGSSPQLSLYMFHFAGQLVSIVTILEVESMREGNKGTMFTW